MPDFEALIRNQQNKQSNSAERLKLVQPQQESNEHINNKLSKGHGGSSFFGAFLGSLIGTMTILIVSEKGLLNIDKIVEIIQPLLY